MDELCFIGEIKLFAITYVPDSFYRCDGSLLHINDNQALYAVIGNTYGGSISDGTFALPNLLGRAALCAGHAPGSTLYLTAATGGAETTRLATAQIPPHAHTFNGRSGNATTRTTTPTNTSYLANFATTPTGGSQTAANGYAPAGSPTINIHPNTIGLGLGNEPASTLPHENRVPFLAVNYYICGMGAFPVPD